MPPDLRNTVLDIVAYNADAATWDKLHAMARGEQSSMIRDQYYGLLARGGQGAGAASAGHGAHRRTHQRRGDDPAVSWFAGHGLRFRHAAHREQVDKLVDTTSARAITRAGQRR